MGFQPGPQAPVRMELAIRKCVQASLILDENKSIDFIKTTNFTSENENIENEDFVSWKRSFFNCLFYIQRNRLVLKDVYLSLKRGRLILRIDFEECIN